MWLLSKWVGAEVHFGFFFFPNVCGFFFLHEFPLRASQLADRASPGPADHDWLRCSHKVRGQREALTGHHVEEKRRIVQRLAGSDSTSGCLWHTWHLLWPKSNESFPVTNDEAVVSLSERLHILADIAELRAVFTLGKTTWTSVALRWSAVVIRHPLTLNLWLRWTFLFIWLMSSSWLVPQILSRIDERLENVLLN